MMSRIGSTESGPAAPMTINAVGRQAALHRAIASPAVTVAMMTFAPPSFFNSAAGSGAWLSM